jgi:alkanesulfonate monooxygenase SsuD/methylene tetrahydromethanopterin reductase-like flavin-dependent oxidoreductase (luciferase family)
MRIGVKPGQWGWTWDALQASWRAAEDSGFDIVSCFDHVSAAPEGRAAWDAPTLLTAMAAQTSRIAIAVDVINVSLRHPFLLAAQLAVAQASSSGRLEIGLGAGSRKLARYDHEALGIPFPMLAERVDQLERACRTLPALWRGEVVSDVELGLDGASLGPLGIVAPPLVVGGRSRSVLDIAARLADGWNVVTADPKEFEDLNRQIGERCTAAGRSRPLSRRAQIFMRDVPFHGARDLVHEFEAAGADVVTFVLVQAGGPEVVRELADAVL